MKPMHPPIGGAAGGALVPPQRGSGDSRLLNRWRARLPALPLIALLLTLSGPAPAHANCGGADQAALQWLERMARSLREADYEGVFTYQYGNRMAQPMRLRHAVRGGLESERVTRLADPGAGVARDGHPLHCLHPGHRLLRLRAAAARPDDGANDSACGIVDHYRLRVAGKRRIAGRPSIVVNVLPRDAYRYGYVLDIDAATGLPLRSQTVAGNGRVLERFQFAALTVGGSGNRGNRGDNGGAQPSSLDAGLSLDGNNGGSGDGLRRAGHSLHSHAKAQRAAKPAPWRVKWLPEGFIHAAGGRGQSFTDGLAAFSVFIETLPEAAPPGEGRAAQGGTMAYTRGMTIAGRPILVTVLGEVPINTARMVADSIRWRGGHAD